ncbi:hypothetical protein MRX96_041688 [Rhipicephalus microplus]
MPEGVLVQAYADDTVVIIPGTTRIALGDKGSEGVGGMERVRLSIRAANSEKSLKFVDILRVLGVVFDRRLFFFAHADHLKEKVNHLAAKVVTFKNMAGLLAEYGGDITPACAQRAMVNGGSNGRTVLGVVSQK